MLGRIGYICLLSIVCLSVGNAYLLNLGELLRIAAIGVGLFAYYWFHLRALQGEASEPPKQMVSILALISVFLFVQFDPAYSGINQLIPQGFVNWYAVVTSILAMIAFASVAVDARVESSLLFLGEAPELDEVLDRGGVQERNSIEVMKVDNEDVKVEQHQDLRT